MSQTRVSTIGNFGTSFSNEQPKFMNASTFFKNLAQRQNQFSQNDSSSIKFPASTITLKLKPVCNSFPDPKEQINKGCGIGSKLELGCCEKMSESEKTAEVQAIEQKIEETFKQEFLPTLFTPETPPDGFKIDNIDQQTKTNETFRKQVVDENVKDSGDMFMFMLVVQQLIAAFKTTINRFGQMIQNFGSAMFGSLSDSKKKPVLKIIDDSLKQTDDESWWKTLINGLLQFATKSFEGIKQFLFFLWGVVKAIYERGKTLATWILQYPLAARFLVLTGFAIKNELCRQLSIYLLNYQIDNKLSDSWLKDFDPEVFKETLKTFLSSAVQKFMSEGAMSNIFAWGQKAIVALVSSIPLIGPIAGFFTSISSEIFFQVAKDTTTFTLYQMDLKETFNLLVKIFNWKDCLRVFEFSPEQYESSWAVQFGLVENRLSGCPIDSNKPKTAGDLANPLFSTCKKQSESIKRLRILKINIENQIALLTKNIESVQSTNTEAADLLKQKQKLFKSLLEHVDYELVKNPPEDKKSTLASAENEMDKAQSLLQSLKKAKLKWPKDKSFPQDKQQDIDDAVKREKEAFDDLNEAIKRLEGFEGTFQQLIK